jgi:four helix bundle protein
MFLQLNHQKLNVFITVKKPALECYKITKTFPADERFNMIQQIRRAALSIILNIAEGSSRKSEAERKRFYEISRGSLIEMDAAFDTANELEYLAGINCDFLGEYINKTFGMLTGLLQNKH